MVKPFKILLFEFLEPKQSQMFTFNKLPMINDMQEFDQMMKN